MSSLEQENGILDSSGVYAATLREFLELGKSMSVISEDESLQQIVGDWTQRLNFEVHAPSYHALVSFILQHPDPTALDQEREARKQRLRDTFGSIFKCFFGFEARVAKDCLCDHPQCE